MLKIRKFLISGVFLVALLAVWLSGCSQEASPSPSAASVSDSTSAVLNNPAQPVSNGVESTKPATIPLKTLSPQEIAINSLTAAEKLSTMKFDMDLNMRFDLGDGDQSHNMSIQEIATGAVNIPGKEMLLLMDLNMNIPDQSMQNMTADMYLTGGWIYMKANMPGAGAGWIKMKLTDELWTQQSRMTSMTEFLKSPVNVEQSGSENIRGIDCYVLSITPDMKAIYEWMAGQTFAGQSGMDPANLNMSPSTGDFKIKEWISKTDYLVVRQQIGIKFNVSTGNTSTTPSGIQNQIAMDMSALLDYYDYGKPVVIQLPPEATNTQEMSLGKPSA